MRRRRRWRWLYGLMSVLLWLVVFAVALIGGALKANPKKATFAPIASFLTGVQDSAWYLLPVLAGVSTALKFGTSTVGSPWLWDAVHVALNELRDCAFESFKDEPVHYHRATLFKKKTGPSFRTKHWRTARLVPIERSGHTTQRTSVLFLIPDDADHAEGVAGLTWAQDGVYRVSELPDLSADPPSDDWKRYAEATGVTVEWLRQERPHARSFCGIPVQIKGKPWGVIVLDSRNPQKIEGDDAYALSARVLGKLLEKA